MDPHIIHSDKIDTKTSLEDPPCINGVKIDKKKFEDKNIWRELNCVRKVCLWCKAVNPRHVYGVKIETQIFGSSNSIVSGIKKWAHVASMVSKSI